MSLLLLFNAGASGSSSANAFGTGDASATGASIAAMAAAAAGVGSAVATGAGGAAGAVAALVGLRTFLLADAAVADLIGTRLYPTILPQRATFPAGTYFRVSGEQHYDTQGQSNLSRPRIQIDVWALSYAAAYAAADAIKDRLSGYRDGAAGSLIKGAFMQSEFDTYEDAGKLWRVSRDYFVFFST